MSAANPVTLPLKGYAARHVRLGIQSDVSGLRGEGLWSAFS